LKTKVNNKKQSKVVHSHNERIDIYQSFYNLTREEAESALILLEENLPSKGTKGYTEQIIAMATRDSLNVSSQVIRLVKMGVTKNPTIFNYLLNFAADKKVQAEAAARKLKETLKSN
jgi:hypothetical protein